MASLLGPVTEVSAALETELLLRVSETVPSSVSLDGLKVTV